MGLVTLGMLDKGWPDFRGPSHPYFKHLHAHESKTLFCAFRNRSRATCPRLASHLWWGREWLELLALLTASSQSWDYTCALPQLIYLVLGEEPSVSRMLGKHCSDRATGPRLSCLGTWCST